MRIDKLLKSLCLVKTRSLAGKGCDTGSVKVNGASVKPSKEVAGGDIIEIRFPDRVLVVEITAVPSGQVAKKDRLEYMRVVRETPLHGDGGGWNA